MVFFFQAYVRADYLPALLNGRDMVDVLAAVCGQKDVSEEDLEDIKSEAWREKEQFLDVLATGWYRRRTVGALRRLCVPSGCSQKYVLFTSSCALNFDDQ